MSDAAHILVSGAASGLGKHCLEKFHATPFTRQTSYQALTAEAQKKPFDVIIHSAFNTVPHIDSAALYDYLQDTLLLTQKLLNLPHKKFIFISTVDVYPKDGEHHYEDEVLHLEKTCNIYALSKLMSESLVLQGMNNLVLRPSAMLGQTAKPNSLIKILLHDNPMLTLMGESDFNYIRHVDVSNFIQHAVKNDLRGIYNLTAATSISLVEVAHHFNRPVRFGDFHYRTAKADNRKAAAMLGTLHHTSMENIKLYLEEGKTCVT